MGYIVTLTHNYYLSHEELEQMVGRPDDGGPVWWSEARTTIDQNLDKYNPSRSEIHLEEA